MKKRVRIVVEVNLDQVPGLFYEGQDFVSLIERSIPHYYDPNVKLVGSFPPERKAPGSALV